MASLFEPPKNLSFNFLGCEVLKGKFLPYIESAEARFIECSCEKYKENGITCKHPQLEDFLKEINGLDFSTVKASQSQGYAIPNLIPVIKKDFFDFEGKFFPFKTIGVTLKDVVSPSPKRLWKKGPIDISENLNIDDEVLTRPIFWEKNVILFMSGYDVLIEKFWEYSLKRNFFVRLGKMGFYSIVAPDFSVFKGECPLRQVYNQKKGLKSFDHLQKAGVIPIPHLYFATEEHLRKWTRWLNENPLVRIISINCQKYLPRDYSVVKKAVEIFIKNTKNPPLIILEGPHLNLLKILQDFAPYLKIAQVRPSVEAAMHNRFVSLDNSLKAESDRNHSSRELLVLNFIKYSLYLRREFWKSLKFQRHISTKNFTKVMSDH